MEITIPAFTKVNESSKIPVDYDKIRNLRISIIVVYIFSIWYLLVFYRFQTLDMESNNMIPTRGDQCDKCGVVKRPDIKHCDECEMCIEGYDHHCVVVGVCIGDYSFKYFC